MKTRTHTIWASAPTRSTDDGYTVQITLLAPPFDLQSEHAVDDLDHTAKPAEKDAAT